MSQYVDFSTLRGDTPPSFIPLRKNGVEIGFIVIWIDNIFVIATDQTVVSDVRAHFMRRAKFVKAHFKIPTDDKGEPLFRDADGQPEPERVDTTAIFLGVTFRWHEDRFIWEHADLKSFHVKVPLSGPRRHFSSIVGSLMWDATVAMEGTSMLQSSFDVIRRITKGVNQRKQWAEIVAITEAEQRHLTENLQRVLTRGPIFVDLSRVSDASNKKVGYVHLPTELPTGLPANENVHAGAARGTHIFYSEFQAAAWAVTDLCSLFPGTMLVLAVDNSALFYVLRRGFTTTEEGRPYMEVIKQILRDTGCDLLPVLIPGLQNVADAPSRDEPLSMDRVLATWRALHAAAHGGSRHLVNFGGKTPRDFLERRLYEEAPGDVLDELDALDLREDDD